MHTRPSSATLARIIGIVLFFMLGGGTEWFLSQCQQEQMAAVRDKTALQAEKIRARLEGELNAVVFSSNGLAAYWPVRRDTANAGESHAILAEAYRHSRHVLSFAVARDYHIAEVFPQDGSGPAIGFDLRSHADWPALRHGIDTRAAVLTGPPSALAYWTPLFAGGQFSGLLAAQIDSVSLLAAAGLTHVGGPYQYALETDGNMLLGAASLLNDPQAIATDIAVPGSHWRLALKAGEAPASSSWAAVLRGLGWLFAGLFAAQSFALFKLNRKLSALALYDRLTGLPAKPLFLDRLKQMIRRTKRNRGKLSVVFVELDDWKTIHQRQGAKVGEMMLAGIGKRLLSAIRHCDTVTRWDGSEFLILLDACPLDQAQLIAENLRHKIELPVSYGGQELRVGASIGLATYPEDGRSLTALLKVAGAKMLQDKSRRSA